MNKPKLILEFTLHVLYDKKRRGLQYELPFHHFEVPNTEVKVVMKLP
jgi:hypothetical protein